MRLRYSFVMGGQVKRMLERIEASKAADRARVKQARQVGQRLLKVTIVILVLTHK